MSSQEMSHQISLILQNSNITYLSLRVVMSPSRSTPSKSVGALKSGPMTSKSRAFLKEKGVEAPVAGKSNLLATDRAPLDVKFSN